MISNSDILFIAVSNSRKIKTNPSDNTDDKRYAIQEQPQLEYCLRSASFRAFLSSLHVHTHIQSCPRHRGPKVALALPPPPP